jgi:23S rRNA (adenine1618-N6)-methyltransferase
LIDKLMKITKRVPEEKTALHERSKHRSPYNFDALIRTCAALKPFVSENKYGNMSVNFADPDAVKTLNKALLMHFYGLSYWDIPPQFLCPPVPGRADYIHYVADLLGIRRGGSIPRGKKVKVLDVGVGANCIYPIIGSAEYGWSFVGSDTEQASIASATKIVKQNKRLIPCVELRRQELPTKVFEGIIKPGERFDLTICNPPFHASAEAAKAASGRKVKNLHGADAAPAQNFGGQTAELWTAGGEKAFIQNMIHESVAFPKAAKWFTTLVSKKESLGSIFKTLEEVKATKKTFNMEQGHKSSRIVAWRF